MTIYNDGTGSSQRGNYIAMTHRKRSNAIQRSGAIQNYDRDNSHVWNLVADALRDMEYGNDA